MSLQLIFRALRSRPQPPSKRNRKKKDTHCIVSRKTAAAKYLWRGRHDRGITSLTWGLDSTARLSCLLCMLIGDSP